VIAVTLCPLPDVAASVPGAISTRAAVMRWITKDALAVSDRGPGRRTCPARAPRSSTRLANWSASGGGFPRPRVAVTSGPCIHGQAAQSFHAADASVAKGTTRMNETDFLAYHQAAGFGGHASADRSRSACRSPQPRRRRRRRAGGGCWREQGSVRRCGAGTKVARQERRRNPLIDGGWSWEVRKPAQSAV